MIADLLPRAPVLTICHNCLHTTAKNIQRCPQCGDDDSTLVLVEGGYGAVWLRGMDVTKAEAEAREFREMLELPTVCLNCGAVAPPAVKES